MFGEIEVHRRATNRVPARRISAVGPVYESILQVELEIDRFGQAVEQQFDIRAISRRRVFWDVNVRAKNAALAGVVRPFLRPINFTAVRINRDTDTPFGQIGPGPRVAFACVDQGFDIRTIQVCAHDAHSFAIAPVKFAALLLEMELLRRECFAFPDNSDAILTVEINALDRTIVLGRNAHVGPVNVTCLNIDNHAIWHAASTENDFPIRPVRLYRMNPAAAGFEKK